MVAQCVGALAGAGVLYVIASGSPDFSLAGGFASNGYADHSPGKYPLLSCLVTEVVMTFGFLIVIHLISIPVTNTSVNPARSLGPAVFVGGWAVQQLWLFWVAPILGALAAGGVYRYVGGDWNPAPVDVRGDV